jgi:predicted Rossmann fold nucleotide-binding protein DprA/Smf involved in DNA uptake
LRNGALLVEQAQDIFDGLFGAGTTRPAPRRPDLPADLQRLLDALAEGHAAPAALHRAALRPEQGLAALASLELAGRIRRDAGGRYSVLP